MEIGWKESTEMRTDDLKPFFEPRGVAIIGARSSPGFGYGIPLVLKENGWGDRIYLVNPRGGELHGMPVSTSVSEVPDLVDLAVVLVPAAAVPQVIEETGARGIRNAIIESAGFAEVGEGGRNLQERVKAAAAKHGMRVIGPNCVGVVNAGNRFSTVEIIDEALTPGSTAIIAQSGVFGNVLLDMLHEYGLFVSKATTLGDRMDIDECDMLDYLSDDPETGVIMMYLEGAADGARLRETLERVAVKKPVLVLKSGRTGSGRAATASHTGSLSGEDLLYDAVFAQTGAIRVSSLEELVETARVFGSQPPARGGRLGVVTTSGSLGVLATDAAVESGLEVRPLSESTVERMRSGAPGWMNVKNPLDVGPSALFAEALSALLDDDEIDMVLAITIVPYAVFKTLRDAGFSPQGWFGDIAAIRRGAPGKPLAVCAVGAGDFIREMRGVSGPEVPVFVSPEPAARALAALYRYWSARADR